MMMNLPSHNNSVHTSTSRKATIKTFPFLSTWKIRMIRIVLICVS